MMRMMGAVVAGLAFALLWGLPAAAQANYELTLLNQAEEEVTALVDGNLLRAAIDMGEAVAEDTTLSLYLDRDAHHLVDCHIPAGEQRCTTGPLNTLGWYWDDQEQIQPQRLVYALNYAETGWLPVASLDITVHPRPVVMIHGYTSTYNTWDEYLGPSGYLALTGLPGYAVGDGQVPGVMHTGNKFRPAQPTNTIARNAEILGEYIAGVKAETGAEQVDLLGHSMGGLIARYYIGRLMDQRDVSQLIMLGTPNGGSDCATLAGTLGIYPPASLELRKAYLREVFNPQITETRGVPFFLIAGTPIQQRVFSPCGDVPNDLMVSLESATLLGTAYVGVPILHKDLNKTESLYWEHIAPLLRQSFQDFARPRAEASLPDVPASEMLQFSQVFTGTVAGLPAGSEGNRHTIHIDRDVVVASFGLYDPSRSLTVTVQGATGNVIELQPDIHGLQTITDPEALFYLGYGFENPRPGPWVVTVHATSRTPPLGAQYALFTLYAGGASVDARLSHPLPRIGEQVELTATLTLGGEPMDFDRAEVVLQFPDGTRQSIPVEQAGETLHVALPPEVVGIHGVDVSLGAVLLDGTVAERTVYLAFEALTPPGGRD